MLRMTSDCIDIIEFRGIWNSCEIRPHFECIIYLIQIPSKGYYTLSFKLSDFTVWRHTWRKTE